MFNWHWTAVLILVPLNSFAGTTELPGGCPAQAFPCVYGDLIAYQIVIAADPFCCETTWDFICQEAFDALSAACDGTPPCPDGEIYDCNGNCAPEGWVGNGSCDDGSFTWNGIPIFFNCPAFNDDNGDCTITCAIVPPDCVQASPMAYTVVIAADPACCDSAWDATCQATFDAISTSCTQGCSPLLPPCVLLDLLVYQIVIADDPFCCETTWDGICQNAFDALSAACDGTEPCPDGEISDCNGNCAPEGWVGNGSCDDGSFTWNGIPIFFNCPAFNDDNGDCTITCAIVPPDCVQASPMAYTVVIAADPACCDSAWDATCQATFDAISTSCTLGCSPLLPPCVLLDLPAYQIVIAADPFCCETAWDSFCQTAFDVISAGCDGQAPTNDVCINAGQLTVWPYGNCPDLGVGGTTIGAGMDGSPASCALPGMVNVFYTFNSGVHSSIGYHVAMSPMETLCIQVLDVCDGTEVHCSANTPHAMFTVEPGSEYVLAVHTLPDQEGIFDVCLQGDIETGLAHLANTCSGVNLWPNPNNTGQLWIDMAGLPVVTHAISVDIHDLSGQRVMAREMALPDRQSGAQHGVMTMNLNRDLAAGTYLVSIAAGERRYVAQLVITH